MGQYNKAVLTTAGEKLIARALAGEIKLSITKAKTSNFAYSENADLKRLTDMQGVRQTVCDPETVVFNETIIQTRVLFSNEDIASTYYIHNIGLYAMDGTHEVLFSIVTAEIPDEMPQYNGVASTSYIYNIQNVIQDAPQLNISVNPSGTASIQDVLERVDATGGDISETVIETLETVEDKYPVPAAGESVKRFLGKVLAFLRNIKPLTSDINVYVSTTGSDITGDGSELNPYGSVGKALGTISKDLGGYTATINISDGTYNEDVIVKGVSNGYLRLQRNGIQALNNLCNVKSISVENCNSVSICGLNLTTTEASSIFGTRTDFINVAYCQSVSNASTQVSFNFDYVSSVRVSGNRSLNHHICLRAYASDVYSENWSADSIGNYGVHLEGSGKICKGNVFQPRGTVANERKWSGGVFISNYGAKIGTLSSDVNLYVATTGSDITGDGTISNPFRTIQYAIDILPKDLGGCTATILLADGAYDQIYIAEFHSGVLTIKPTARVNTISDACVVKNIRLTKNAAFVHLNSLKVVEDIGAFVVYVSSSLGVTRFDHLKIVETNLSWSAIEIYSGSKINVMSCEISNHANAIYADYGDVYISSCTGSGNNYSIRGNSGARITTQGTIPSYTVTNGAIVTSAGATYFNSNGTQISDDITYGLSCTWGTIRSGYVRHGNYNSAGSAIVIVNCRIDVTSNLTANTPYTISGFPIPAITGFSTIAVSVDIASKVSICSLEVNGRITFMPSVNISSGANFALSATYKTNS